MPTAAEVMSGSGPGRTPGPVHPVEFAAGASACCAAAGGTGTFLDWTDAAEVSVVAGTAQEAHTHQLPGRLCPWKSREGKSRARISTVKLFRHAEFSAEFSARSCTEKTPLADSENRGKIDQVPAGAILHALRIAPLARSGCSLALLGAALAGPAESTCAEDLDGDGMVTVSNAEISLSVHHTGSNSRAT